MAFLIDTNVLLRTLITDDPQYEIVQTAIAALRRSREQLFIAPQNLIEMWNVAIRPSDKNGLGLSPIEVKAEVSRLKELFILLPDTEQMYSEWERLVSEYEVRGTKVHDTRLVAFMLIHSLSHILTFNVKDFRRFEEEVTPKSPEEIVGTY
ncbi:putative nucleic acid-binding protein [Xenococcus sp. PCC 7305]|uniref:type II toxin-antitoxin system VapC family toxin n=1 Tax=Xenococcus sp. PCC 7305 TaxID=102125 RepID=UPI0002AC5282|nr:PIN domain-containing protein [Xenococcus sp. PCC 7305]ELS03962.1 putative nucleic acid-binding protein [Xenococcus sp. PCC 7305]